MVKLDKLSIFPLYRMGYQQIVGVDLTPEMIERALVFKEQYQVEIAFTTGYTGRKIT